MTKTKFLDALRVRAHSMMKMSCGIDYEQYCCAFCGAKTNFTLEVFHEKDCLGGALVQGDITE